MIIETKLHPEFKPKSQAQQWAHKRNWAKCRLMGCSVISAYDILTSREYASLLKADRLIRDVLNKWKEQNEQSKTNYLKRNK